MVRSRSTVRVGRPTTEPRDRRPINIYLSAELRAALDDARGLIPMQRFVVAILEEEMRKAKLVRRIQDVKAKVRAARTKTEKED